MATKKLISYFKLKGTNKRDNRSIQKENEDIRIRFTSSS